ncbi:XIAP-associated factor 1 isoform X2 [Nycticebus coucang]|uniref:XIAP-associated factor 1 isoform X2 n=1 Tax=Nycticebus coucang TaxID=9470 RepID=UPI00234DB218|nr:XIAP-associated factor 1 isoform X2 [Nycticebus coucang]
MKLNRKTAGDQEMEDTLQVCPNCKKNVASFHFALHEAHCLRFLVFCPECEEAIPRAKMEEHRKACHQQEDFTDADMGQSEPRWMRIPYDPQIFGRDMHQQSVQKPSMEFHEAKECQEHSSKCKFCKLAMQLSKLEVHEFQCGNRTELCPNCGQFITLQVLAQHKDVCWHEQAQLKKGERISASEREIYYHCCNQTIPENNHSHHMENSIFPNSEFEKHFPVGELTIPPPSLPSQAAKNQTSTAEEVVRPKIKNINGFPLLSGSSSKQASSGKNKTGGLPPKSEFKTRTTSSVEDETDYDILRRCSQCGILLPLPTLNQHQRYWFVQRLQIKLRKKKTKQNRRQFFSLRFLIEPLCPDT